MKYLSVKRVVFIHDQAIKRFGGSFGIRDLGLIESAVMRPQSSFDGQDLYQTLFQKAAALLHLLLKNHAFVDGNKRTSMAATGIFLKLNGYRLKNKKKEEVEFAINVENESISLKEIAEWLENNSKKVE